MTGGNRSMANGNRKLLGAQWMIVVLSFISVGEAQVCSNASGTVCDSYFMLYRSLQLTGGCFVGSLIRPTQLGCAMNCFHSKNCTAFSYNVSSRVCQTCTGSLIKALTFFGGDFSLQRKMSKINLALDPGPLETIMFINVPGGVTPGRLLYIYATLLTNDSFNFDFTKYGNDSYIHFHFRARYDNATSKVIVLNHCWNGSWHSPEVLPSFAYPFSINQSFSIHVLVTPACFIIYVNQALCCQYNHSAPVEDINYVRVSGKIKVHEISI
nr:putative galectin-3 [Biomphalaria glabrata]